MEQSRTFFREIKSINNLVVRRISLMLGEQLQGMTPMHSMILAYLNANPEREIYQKDLEAEFSITRSTVTSILNLMEKKGYIRRESVAQDARLKRIVCTPLGVNLHQRMSDMITTFNLEIDQALGADDSKKLMQLLEKIRTTLEQDIAS